MIAEQFLIIKEFIGISVELTINQISKKIKKSYAFTNKYVHELIKEDILNKREIGPSILCSLNLKNQKILAILVYISMSDAKVTDKKGIIISYKDKIMRLDEKKLSKLMKGFDFSVLKVLCGHEQFWKIFCEVGK